MAAAKPAPLLPLSCMLHACHAEASLRAMSIAPPAEHVRQDAPLAYRSRGSYRAAALWSSSRFVSTTCAACRQRGEAPGELRLTTEDRRRAREGLRFDSRALRTLSSSKWMKSEAPTSLETDLDVKSDLVAVPRAPSALRRSARYAFQQGSSADPSFELCTTSK